MAARVDDLDVRDDFSLLIGGYVPFGGAKKSGMGRQHSVLGLKGYMEPQVISVTNQGSGERNAIR